MLKAGAAYSRVMDDKGAKMLHHDFTRRGEALATPEGRPPDSRLRRAKGAKVPLSQVHRQLLERLEAAGYGEVDNSAIIMAYDQ